MAIPIPPSPTPSVYQSHQERLRRRLRAAGCPAALVTPGSSFRYLTGREPSRSERLQAIVVLAPGGLLWVVAAFEALSAAPPPGCTETIAWQETEDPYRRLADRLRQEDSLGPLLLEPTTFVAVAESLRDALGARSVASGEELFSAVRILKEPEEVALLRAAQRCTAEVIEETFASLEVGMSDQQIQSTIARAYASRGVDGWALVQIDESSANPHDLPSGRRLGERSIVLIDSGAIVHGYHGDMTRTIQLGGSSREFQHIHGIVQQAHDQAITRARPRITAGELDFVARNVINEAGYGEAFLHRLGHGIGLDGHEPPYLCAGSDLPLESGMAMTIEPGIYLGGRFGVRVEDLIVMTKDGCEVL